MLTGGCYCGRIRYEAHGAFTNTTLCHCIDCRRVSGAPVVAWFTIKAQDLRFIREQPVFFSSSAEATRGFCPHCGTPLTWAGTHTPEAVDVTICSLDAPDLVPPLDHTHVAGGVSWLKLADSLPRFPASSAG